MPQLKLKHDRDPKEVLLEEVGDVSGFVLVRNDCLIAMYERGDASDTSIGQVSARQTESGLWVADKSLKDDKYMGKVGLVLSVGPDAFVSDDKVRFYTAANGDPLIQEGDWIVFRPQDGWPVQINGKSCRVVADYHIKARVDHPDLAY